MILIGITGTLGAGKGTLTDYLVNQKGFAHVSVSEFLAEEALRRGLASDRMARHNIANEFRARGATALMEAVYASVDPASQNVVLEPQHTEAEVNFIKQAGGIVLSVTADLKVRYERISKRGSPKDNVTFEEFSMVQNLEMSSHDPRKNNLKAAMTAADFQLTNDNTPEQLYEQVDKVLKKIKERV